MRIAYFVNSFNAINWGGQATSTGLKNLVEKNYPEAEFVPLDLPVLPYKNFPFLRRFLNGKLAHAILRGDGNAIAEGLSRLNLPADRFEGFDTVCFNGEGAIHSRSGHLIRLMGMLACFKQRRAFVSALNQTVDLAGRAKAREVVAMVYRAVDYLAVREPVSRRELADLGLEADVVPDAAFALPRLSREQIARHTDPLGLPARFIGVTGSSALKRGSVRVMDRLLEAIRGYYKDIPVVFLANTKTDIALAEALKRKHGYTVVKPPVKYEQAMAVIARAHLIIGGRQHPNIFAAMHHVPFIPFQGNTHKMEGLVELLNYPVAVLPWNASGPLLRDAFEKTGRLYDSIRRIEAPRLADLCLSPRNHPCG